MIHHLIFSNNVCHNPLSTAWRASTDEGAADGRGEMPRTLTVPFAYSNGVRGEAQA